MRFVRSGLLGAGALLGLFIGGCYTTGDGTEPPPRQFYFPTGLAVSAGGHVLYVANSDFDLQFNGGTLQSYDLRAVRGEAAARADAPPDALCAAPLTDDGRRKARLGEACAPPVDSTQFVRGSVIIGAFATDLQRGLDVPKRALVAGGVPGTTCPGDELPRDPDRILAQRDDGDSPRDRLFVPIRGDTSLTWADVTRDRADDPSSATAAFELRCGAGEANGGRCDFAHRAGARGAEEADNTRNERLPGEPFGMAQSPDGQFVVLTHQTEQRASLFSTGYVPGVGFDERVPPALLHVAGEITVGGNGIAAVPLDLAVPPQATPEVTDACPGAERPAFLVTTRAAAELQLLRVYSDRGVRGVAGEGEESSLRRPFLVKESSYAVNVNATGNDSRGIVIDPSPRIACKLAAQTDAERAACGRRPSRVFFANRAPASLVVGEVGETTAAGEFDPTRVRLSASIPLAAGPSRVYLAPVVDREGLPSLRVFVVCYDANLVYVFDPATSSLENIVRVAPGPFAMAFDPYSLYEVVARRQLGKRYEPRDGILPYRFGYVASFSRSYVQVIDLDAGRVPTYQTVVYTLGFETIPKGTK